MDSEVRDIYIQANKLHATLQPFVDGVTAVENREFIGLCRATQSILDMMNNMIYRGEVKKP